MSWKSPPKYKPGCERSLLARSDRRHRSPKWRSKRSFRERATTAPSETRIPGLNRDAPGPGRWYRDPTGRNDGRYWNGRVWTDQVRRRDGVEATDSIARGYARPEQFCFNEKNSSNPKAFGAWQG